MRGDLDGFIMERCALHICRKIIPIEPNQSIELGHGWRGLVATRIVNLEELPNQVLFPPSDLFGAESHAGFLTAVETRDVLFCLRASLDRVNHAILSAKYASHFRACRARRVTTFLSKRRLSFLPIAWHRRAGKTNLERVCCRTEAISVAVVFRILRSNSY